MHENDQLINFQWKKVIKAYIFIQTIHANHSFFSISWLWVLSIHQMCFIFDVAG